MIHFNFADSTRLIFCFVLAFIFTFLIIPSIVNIARAKSLVSVPGERDSHKVDTPTLGGIGMINGFVISCLIFLDFNMFPRFQYLIAGLMVIFYIGIKDDIIGIDPLKKFIGQLIAALIVIYLGGIRITNLHGFSGFYDLYHYVGLFLSLVTIVGVTNCFNLMDGIDGLSASLGITAAAIFGIWFYFAGEYNWVVLSAGLIGALLPFFYFNVFGKKYKIFMGDTGSLFLGYILSVMAIKFNELNIGLTGPYAIPASPAVSIGILMVPIFDTLRVFITRILKNKPPFSPDKTHIHHYLLELGFSHLAATLVLFAASLIFVLVSFCLRDLTVFWLLVILFSLAAFLSYIPITLVNLKLKRARILGKQND